VDIIGTGFVARGLAPIAGHYPEVVAFAAGPSRTAATGAECDREAALLTDTLAACRRSGGVLLYCSTASAAMYTDPSRPGREDDDVRPRQPYGGHKRSMELIIAGSGCRHLILRLSHLVGPGQPRHQLIPALADQIQSGTVTLYTGARRDLLDVADAIRIIDALLSAGVRDEVVNVASGYSVPVGEIVDHLERRTGWKAARTAVSGGDASFVSIEKLTGLVPEVKRLGFGPLYYQRAIDRYIAAMRG
jgi:nucleoside-diphosphate-sugar epimerase